MKAKTLGLLFIQFLYISSFCFGGGYVIIPLIQKPFVEKYHLLEEEELFDIAAVAQSCPGAIAVNISTLVGYRIGGLLGSLVSVIATILPPLVIISVVTVFYDTIMQITAINAVMTGLGIGVIIVIFDFIVDSYKKFVGNQRFFQLLFVVTFICILFFNISVAIMLLCDLVVITIYSLWSVKEVAQC